MRVIVVILSVGCVIFNSVCVIGAMLVKQALNSMETPENRW